MTENELKKYWEIFVDAWQLFKRFAGAGEKDMGSLLEQARCLDKKHESQMSREIILATIDEIERKIIDTTI